MLRDQKFRNNIYKNSFSQNNLNLFDRLPPRFRQPRCHEPSCQNSEKYKNNKFILLRQRHNHRKGEARHQDRRPADQANQRHSCRSGILREQLTGQEPGHEGQSHRMGCNVRKEASGRAVFRSRNPVLPCEGEEDFEEDKTDDDAGVANE